MAKITVIYTAILKQTIDWPDDEMDALDYDTLFLNLEHEEAKSTEDYEPISVKKDGVEIDLD